MHLNTNTERNYIKSLKPLICKQIKTNFLIVFDHSERLVPNNFLCIYIYYVKNTCFLREFSGLDTRVKSSQTTNVFLNVCT